MADLSNGTGPAVKRIICGAKLQRAVALGTYSPTLLALLGHDLRTGEVAITVTTPRQTAALTGLPMTLLRTVRRATALELCAMKGGRYTIGALHAEQLGNRRRLSDAALKKIMVEQGLDRILAMLDELTVPSRANGHANDNANGNGVPTPVQLSL
jgi:hypothetical protein